MVSGLVKETRGRVLLGSTPVSFKERLEICHLVLQQADHQLFTASVRSELSAMPGQADRAKDRQEIIHALGLDGLMD